MADIARSNGPHDTDGGKEMEKEIEDIASSFQTTPNIERQCLTQAPKSSTPADVLLRNSYKLRTTYRGHAAIPHPIDPHNLNPDDKIILEVKTKGCSDEDTAEYVKKYGTIEYTANTIRTRFGRICDKLAAAAKGNDLKMEEKTTWTDQDDRNLIMAMGKAQAVVSYIKDELAAKYFHLVAFELQKIEGQNNHFFGPACEKRFCLIQSGALDKFSALVDSDIQEEVQVLEDKVDLYSEKLKIAREKVCEEIQDVLEVAAISARKEAPTQSEFTAINQDETEPDATTTRKPPSPFGFPGLGIWLPRALPYAYRAEQVAQELEGVELQAVEGMEREDMRAELAARGISMGRGTAQMKRHIIAARSGDPDLPLAEHVPDGAELRRRIENKRRRAETEGGSDSMGEDLAEEGAADDGNEEGGLFVPSKKRRLAF